jgi:hypothetical protein
MQLYRWIVSVLTGTIYACDAETDERHNNKNLLQNLTQFSHLPEIYTSHVTDVIIERIES